jgi:quercetin dioxygenase-like cupin family protein
MRTQETELRRFAAPPGQVSITVLEGAARCETEREEDRVISAGDPVRVGR